MVLQAREEMLAFRFIAGISKNDTRAKTKLALGRWRRRAFMFQEYGHESVLYKFVALGKHMRRQRARPSLISIAQCSEYVVNMNGTSFAFLFLSSRSKGIDWDTTNALIYNSAAKNVRIVLLSDISLVSKSTTCESGECTLHCTRLTGHIYNYCYLRAISTSHPVIMELWLRVNNGCMVSDGAVCGKVQ